MDSLMAEEPGVEAGVDDWLGVSTFFPLSWFMLLPAEAVDMFIGMLILLVCRGAVETFVLAVAAAAATACAVYGGERKEADEALESTSMEECSG